MRKACGLVVSAVVFFNLSAEVVNVVYHNGNDLVNLARISLFAYFGPETAQGLRNDCRAVVVALNTAVLVTDDKEYGCLARIFGGGECGVELVEACKHHLKACLACKRAGLEVDNSVEHLGLLGGDHLCRALFVVPVNAVCHLHKALFHKSGYVSAGVVVRCVYDTDAACVVYKLVAVKTVTHRRVVMLALADEVELAVLADSEAAHAGNGSHGCVCGVRKRCGRGALVVVFKCGHYLLAHVFQHFIALFLLFFGEKVDLFVCDRHGLGVGHNSQRLVCACNGLCVVSAEDIGKGQFG